MPVSPAQRAAVTERANARCEYCLSPLRFSPAPFAIEHILPRALGGEDALNNLALSCQGCNNSKAARTDAVDPSTGLTSRLYHPRQDRWQEHFAWSSGYVTLLGLTPIGRVTIRVLRLNRPGVVELRGAMFRLGLHPSQADDEAFADIG